MEAEENARAGWPASSSHISAKCLLINMYSNGYLNLLINWIQVNMARKIAMKIENVKNPNGCIVHYIVIDKCPG